MYCMMIKFYNITSATSTYAPFFYYRHSTGNSIYNNSST